VVEGLFRFSAVVADCPVLVDGMDLPVSWRFLLRCSKLRMLGWDCRVSEMELPGPGNTHTFLSFSWAFFF